MASGRTHMNFEGSTRGAVYTCTEHRVNHGWTNYGLVHLFMITKWEASSVGTWYLSNLDSKTVFKPSWDDYDHDWFVLYKIINIAAG